MISKNQSNEGLKKTYRSVYICMCVCGGGGG